MDNFGCQKWVTTNQDEFQDPASVFVNKNIESAEFARYENCISCKDSREAAARATARDVLCTTEQECNREPVCFPTDSNIDEKAQAKPPWCRCLATGDPNCYDENRDEIATDQLCCCKKMYRQEEPTPDHERQKIYSTTHFIDFRDPNYNYIASKDLNKKKFDAEFLEYKAAADARDAEKEPKIMPETKPPENTMNPNCLGIFESMPPPKKIGSWKADESWWRTNTSDCVKNMVKKYIWTSTYREMNKDGAALPITKHKVPETCLENPPGNPIKKAVEMAPCTLFHLGDVFEKWDRPQVRHVAQRCDTMYNCPCLKYDTYFKDHHLDRAKFARCTEFHQPPSQENLELVAKEKLRQPYDRMIPGYSGYVSEEAPPVCKIRKPRDPNNPDLDMSTYQVDFMRFPSELYQNKGSDDSFKPLDFAKHGINPSPILTLSKIPLPCVSRLSCYLECGKSKGKDPKA